MPPYPGLTGSLVPSPIVPTVLYPGDNKYLWGTSVASGAAPTPGQQQAPTDANAVFEAVSVSEASIAFSLAAYDRRTPGLSLVLIANANPGAAEIDIQDASIDADGAYVAQTTSTAYKVTSFAQVGTSAYYIATVELQPSGAPFTRLFMVANPNAVSWLAKVVYV